MLWITYFAILFLTIIIRDCLIDPDLIRERNTQGTGHDLRTTILLLAHWIAALLFPYPIPVEVSSIALGAFLGGCVINTWAMTTNRFFSSRVRLQADRGQYVVTDGPYRFVRHPGYAANIVSYAASGIVLGSWVATLIGVIGAATIIPRLNKEEKLLMAELPGYRQYAEITRWRLVSGVW